MYVNLLSYVDNSHKSSVIHQWAHVSFVPTYVEYGTGHERGMYIREKRYVHTLKTHT